MNNLLHAGFARVRKSKLFYIGTIIMIIIGTLEPIMTYIDSQKYNYNVGVEDFFFSYTVFIAFIASVFCSMFVGTEYSDGTIRNKLIVGHARVNIYLSNLIFCIVSCLAMQVVYIILSFGIGLPLLGTHMTYKFFIVPILGIVLLTICFCALFTMIAMSCQNKSITAVICTIGLISSLCFGIYTYSKLEEPEFYEAYTYTDETGTEYQPREINPNYLRGTKRVVYEYLCDCNPGAQILKYSEGGGDHNDRMLISAGILTILFTAAGIIIFKKKDIK